MNNKVKEKILRNEKPVGTFLVLATQGHVESLGDVGLDYVIIDTEHGPFDTQTVANLIRGSEHANLTPFVRVGDTTHKELQRCLDLGAKGIIIPMLSTIDDFKKVVALSKFMPLGNRGFAGVRYNNYGYDEKLSVGIEDFMKECNEEVMILPQCETAEALDIIEEVVNLEGIDGIFVGPFDLSISLGIPLQFTNPIFINALDKILLACKNAGKPALIYAGNIDSARDAFNKGFDSVAYSLDSSILINGFKTDIEAIRK